MIAGFSSCFLRYRLNTVCRAHLNSGVGPLRVKGVGYGFRIEQDEENVMRKVALTLAASLFALMLTVSASSVQNIQQSQEHTQWIAKSLQEIQSIKVGMTRADLLRVFTTEGGLSTGLNRTYVYRECPLIKVDVEFEPVGRPARDVEGRVTLSEADEDVIKKISKPYLEWSIVD